MFANIILIVRCNSQHFLLFKRDRDNAFMHASRRNRKQTIKNPINLRNFSDRSCKHEVPPRLSLSKSFRRSKRMHLVNSTSSSCVRCKIIIGNMDIKMQKPIFLRSAFTGIPISCINFSIFSLVILITSAHVVYQKQ